MSAGLGETLLGASERTHLPQKAPAWRTSVWLHVLQVSRCTTMDTESKGWAHLLYSVNLQYRLHTESKRAYLPLEGAGVARKHVVAATV
jgi:hypothetical protein